jgi:hypothetical protein
MREVLKESPRFDFKEVWILVCFSVLVVYLIGLLKPDSELGTIATRDWLLVWMIFMSFPASILFMFFILSFTWLDYEQDFFGTMLMWAGLFAVGYLQWCRLVPFLFMRDRMITLNLKQRSGDKTLGPYRRETYLSYEQTERPEARKASSTPSDQSRHGG